MGQLFGDMDVQISTKEEFATTVAEFYKGLVANGLPVETAGSLTSAYLAAWFNSLALLPVWKKDDGKTASS